MLTSDRLINKVSQAKVVPAKAGIQTDHPRTDIFKRFNAMITTATEISAST